MANENTKAIVSDEPCVVKISQNAKGDVQLEIRLAYKTPDDLLELSDSHMYRALTSQINAVHTAGLKLAGE